MLSAIVRRSREGAVAKIGICRPGTGTGRRGDDGIARAEADAEVAAGRYEAALYFPPDFARRLESFRAAVRRQAHVDAGPALRLEVPSPEIIHSTANEKSRVGLRPAHRPVAALERADRRG